MNPKHPHARGEDAPQGPRRSVSAETPPRTWGRHELLDSGGGHNGNTPTHVGKTLARAVPGRHGGKHPHARGEDDLGMADSTAIWETPPRTWGRRQCAAMPTYLNGNTPTHVGKTHRVLWTRRRAEKHPHARGEDTWNLLAFFLLTFNKELGRHLNQKLKIFPFGRNTGLQAKKSNSSVDESLSPQCTWL